MSDKSWLFVFPATFSTYLTLEAPDPRRKELLKKQFLRRKQLLLVTRTEDNLVLRNRLKELHARDRLSQTQLVKLAKVSRRTISLLEHDEYTSLIVIALRITHMFSEPIENVFSLDKEGEER